MFSNDKLKGKAKGAYICMRAAITATFMTGASTMAVLPASASYKGDSTLGSEADGLMDKVIGILLSICRYAGIALLIYGIYEIAMSFMQNQAEAKTKGIIMALAGVVMIGIKSIVNGVIGGGGDGGEG